MINKKMRKIYKKTCRRICRMIAYNGLFELIYDSLYGKGALQKLRLKKISIEHPSLLEMSEMDTWLSFLHDETIENSDCAKEFHRQLLKRANIDAKASFIYGDINSIQLGIHLWVEDNETSADILHGYRYIDMLYPQPYFDSIVEALCAALEKHDKRCYEKVALFFENEKKGVTWKRGEHNAPYLRVSFQSFMGVYRENLFGGTTGEITDLFKREFSQYWRLECISTGALYDGINIEHEFLFLTPDDQKKAHESGDYEKMRELAYGILSREDDLHKIAYQDYTPKTSSRRDYTREQLFVISRY